MNYLEFINSPIHSTYLIEKEVITEDEYIDLKECYEDFYQKYHQRDDTFFKCFIVSELGKCIDDRVGVLCPEWLGVLILISVPVIFLLGAFSLIGIF